MMDKENAAVLDHEDGDSEIDEIVDVGHGLGLINPSASSRVRI
jgi:hypothetical protein